MIRDVSKHTVGVVVARTGFIGPAHVEGLRPNKLWLGHRAAPNQMLWKDPSLLSPEARAVSSYPGGHNEGFPDTFKQLYAKVYDYIFKGDYNKKPDFPTFADGHYEMQLCEAIQRSAAGKAWVKVG